MEHNESLNCAIIEAEKGEHTLQEIGDIFGVTRMRICQMEKTIMHVMNFHQCIKSTSD
jgi:DNA-directed RNA polymerase sigma subunit (sigma70/sigma32)